MTEELHYLTIIELAPLIESKAVSPVEVTETILKRIEAVGGRFATRRRSVGRWG